MKDLLNLLPGGERFRLVGIVPSTLAFTLVVLALAGGAPGKRFDPKTAAAAVQGLATSQLALMFLLVLVFAIVLQPMQLPLVRLLEGYWSARSLRPLRTWRVRRHQNKRDKLERAQSVNDSVNDLEDASEAAWLLRRSYPARKRTLATRLGNVLRASEDRAGSRYGLDAVTVWPRLYVVLSVDMKNMLNDRRNQLDAAVRLTATLLITGPVLGVLLLRSGIWLAVPGAVVLVSFFTYRVSVVAAAAYGEVIECAFDLFRFDLLRALHLKLPLNRDMEKQCNEALMRFLAQGVPFNLEYQHELGSQTTPTSTGAQNA
jgi:hypothetical protein